MRLAVHRSGSNCLARAGVGLLALLGSALVCATAEAEGWKRLISAASSAETDGKRWVAWLRSGGVLEARSDQGARRAIDVENSCPVASGPIVGSGVALMSCSDTPGTVATSAITVELASGSIARVPLSANAVEGANFLAVGDRWAEYESSLNKSTSREYVNLSTGEIRQVEGRDETPDLDTRRLVLNLCSPVRRPPNPDEDDENVGAIPSYGRVATTGQWTVFNRTAPRGLPIFAWRCGQPRPIVLSGCLNDGGECPEPAVGAGLVTWKTKHRMAVVHLAKPGKVISVRGPRVHGRRPAFYPVHTKRRLFATVYTSSGTVIFQRSVPHG